MFGLLVFAYLLGGLTCLPILLLAGVAFLYFTSPLIDVTPPLPKSTFIDPLEKQESESLPSSDPLDLNLPKLYRAGWLTVRQTYEPTQAGDATYMGMLTNSYRTFMDQRSKDPKRSRPKDQFYTVLKQNVLFLYEDDTQADCAAAIEVTLYDALLYPEPGPDGELYVKRRAICLRPHHHATSGEPTHLGDSRSVHTSNEPEMAPERQIAGQPLPWFIFTKTNDDKEDWYHILLASSKLACSNPKATFAKDARLFDPQDMAELVDGIDQQPDPIPMRWLNAMLGRVFLSTYRTASLESWIIDRIMKKLERVKTPGFLSAIKVREVDVGSSTPFFSKPMLKELTGDGDASMEVHVNYAGRFRITIETIATINLSSRFKPYVVNLVLAVNLKELEGTLLFKVKKPPTNRLWFGFTTMPRLVLQLDPVVSTRQIKWALVLKPIESRIREVILESIVVPHLDDLVFFDTQMYSHRGGIWGDALRKDDSLESDASSPDEHGPEDDIEKTCGIVPSHDDRSHATSQATELENATTTSREPVANPETLRQRVTSKIPTTLEQSTDNHVLSSYGESPFSSLPPQSLESTRSSWFSTTRKNEAPVPPPFQTSPRASSKHDTTNASVEIDGEAIAKLKEVLRPRAESNRVVTPSHHFQTLPADFHPSASVVASPDTTLSDALPYASVDRMEHNDAADHSLYELVTPISTLAAPSEGVQDGTLYTQLDTSSTLRSESSTDLSHPERILRRLPPAPPPRPPGPQFYLPPPQRQATTRTSESSMSSIGMVGNASTGSILNQLRTRAGDKDAITASMTQAKDVVKKWGASWTAKRKPSQSTPYTNGFNPISIDTLSDVPQPRPSLGPDNCHDDLMNMEFDKDADSRRRLPSAHMDRSTVIEATHAHPVPQGTREHEPLEDHALSGSLAVIGSSLYTDPRVSGLRPKTSSSRLSIAASEDSSTKRNRTIYSANGQFIPAAPQSTTGLSISSAQLNVQSEDEQNEPGLTPTRASPSTKFSPSQSATMSTERASYKPAPMMAIPGIKDSSHRFALGSDSLVGKLADATISDPDSQPLSSYLTTRRPASESSPNTTGYSVHKASTLGDEWTTPFAAARIERLPIHESRIHSSELERKSNLNQPHETFGSLRQGGRRLSELTHMDETDQDQVSQSPVAQDIDSMAYS